MSIEYRRPLTLDVNGIRRVSSPKTSRPRRCPEAGALGAEAADALTLVDKRARVAKTPANMLRYPMTPPPLSAPKRSLGSQEGQT
jgi:hypothetical protein